MQEQQQLSFSDPDFLDALDSLIERLGGRKVVGSKLRPNKDPDDSAKWVSNCLDKGKRDKFDISDVLRLLRAGQSIGFHEAKHYLDKITGYHDSQPKSVADEKEDLMRVIVNNQELLKQAYMQLGALADRERGGW